MTYRYTISPFRSPGGTLTLVKRPIVAVEIFGPLRRATFSALVDSGADISLFQIDIANMLGIDLTNAPTKPIAGISGTITGYYVKAVEIQLEGATARITIPAYFAASPTIGALLGQEGFFDQHRIVFTKSKDTFQLIPAAQ